MRARRPRAGPSRRLRGARGRGAGGEASGGSGRAGRGSGARKKRAGRGGGRARRACSSARLCAARNGAGPAADALAGAGEEGSVCRGGGGATVRGARASTPGAGGGGGHRRERLHEVLEQLVQPRESLRWQPPRHLDRGEVRDADVDEARAAVRLYRAAGDEEAEAGRGHGAASQERRHPPLPKGAHRRRARAVHAPRRLERVGEPHEEQQRLRPAGRRGGRGS